jgi:ribulose 1,5-bisphosphate carboxylase large subunit-like protein
MNDEPTREDYYDDVKEAVERIEEYTHVTPEGPTVKEATTRVAKTDSWVRNTEKAKRTLILSDEEPKVFWNRYVDDEESWERTIYAMAFSVFRQDLRNQSSEL